MRSFLLSTALIAGIGCSTTHAATRWVDSALGNDANNSCLGPATPCKSITRAMSVAVSGAPGDTISVAPGSYNSSKGEVFPINMVSGVQLIGVAGAYATIIDGRYENKRLMTMNGTNSSTLIRGFTFQQGGVNVSPTPGAVSMGAAILISGGDSSTVERNYFFAHQVQGVKASGATTTGGDAMGGAIYVAASQPMIRNNVFASNLALAGGGKDYFTQQTGGTGGNAYGGAIYAEGGTIINNTFLWTTAMGGYGGDSGAGAGGTGGNAFAGAVYSNGADVINNIFAYCQVTSGIGGDGPASGGQHSGPPGTATYTALVYFNAPNSSNNLFFSNKRDNVIDDAQNTLGPNALIADPLFSTQIVKYDYAVRITSPANGSGTAVGSPTSDFEGRARSNPPARGAFEPPNLAMPVADFDGDGLADIMWRNDSNGMVYRMSKNGFWTTSEALVYNEPNLDWKVVSDGDFDGDGVSDLLWRNSATGQVYLMPFGTNGMPSGGALIYTEPNPAWKIVATPDIDGDGNADIVWWNSSTGQVYVMLMHGYQIGTQGFAHTEPDTNTKIVGAGDFSGTGKQNELLWRNSATGVVTIMPVTVVGSGFTVGGQPIYQEPNTAWKIVGIGDFNGDGKSDVLSRNDTTGQVYLRMMDGGTIIREGQIWVEPNLAWKIVAVADFNGDGKADILWRNDSTGVVYMILMNAMGLFDATYVFEEPNTAWKILGPAVYAQ